MKPKDVTKQNEKKIYSMYKKSLKLKLWEEMSKNWKLVIKSEYASSNMFLKKVIHQIGRQKYSVSQIKNTEPTTYLLEDYQNKPISGSFHEQELAKVKNPDIY